MDSEPTGNGHDGGGEQDVGSHVGNEQKNTLCAPDESFATPWSEG